VLLDLTVAAEVGMVLVAFAFLKRVADVPPGVIIYRASARCCSVRPKRPAASSAAAARPGPGSGWLRPKCALEFRRRKYVHRVGFPEQCPCPLKLRRRWPISRRC
jgi:hypothetical protein